jgi:hypothetical protein
MKVDRISINPNVCHGKPVIKNTIMGIPVYSYTDSGAIVHLFRNTHEK